MADEVVDKATWIVDLGTGYREWRERINGGYSVVKTEEDPAPASHTHSAYSGEFEGTITKIKIENGLVTEVEVE